MPTPQKFQKLPVVIEAIQFTPEVCWENWIDRKPVWEGTALSVNGSYHAGNRTIREAHILIETLEGTVTAQLGDWIIKGVKGEFYPCKPDIFAATYKSASNHANASAEEATSCVKQPCGHCVSLEVRSVESPAIMCELCEMRSQRNDALEMEKHYKEKLSEEAEKYRRLVEAAKWVNFNPYSSEYQRELRSALAPFKEE